MSTDHASGFPKGPPPPLSRAHLAGELASLTLLSGVPVPPMLEGALRLPETPARYVGLYWHPAGDEANFDTGRSAGTADWHGYLAWTDHPACVAEFEPWDTGGSFQQPRDWLLLDRTARKVYVGPWRTVRGLLRDQWQEGPLIGPLVLSQAQRQQMVERVRAEMDARVAKLTSADVVDGLKRQQAVVESLTAWLDAWQKGGR